MGGLAAVSLFGCIWRLLHQTYVTQGLAGFGEKLLAFLFGQLLGGFRLGGAVVDDQDPILRAYFFLVGLNHFSSSYTW